VGPPQYALPPVSGEGADLPGFCVNKSVLIYDYDNLPVFNFNGIANKSKVKSNFQVWHDFCL